MFAILIYFDTCQYSIILSILESRVKGANKPTSFVLIFVTLGTTSNHKKFYSMKVKVYIISARVNAG